MALTVHAVARAALDPVTPADPAQEGFHRLGAGRRFEALEAVLEWRADARVPDFM